MSTRVSQIDRGWISLESVTFSEPLEDAAAILAQACDVALGRLRAQQRQDLENLLQLGDFEIPSGSLRISRRPTAQEQAEDLGAQLATLVGRQLDTYTLPTRLAEAAALLQGQNHGFLGKLKGYFKKKARFKLGEAERQAAADAGREMRQVIARTLDASATEGRIERERAVHLDQTLQAFAARKGIDYENFDISHGTIKMVMGGAIPSVNPDEANFTKLSYGHSEKYAEAVRHEVVHVMHCTQARHTAMEQVCAKHGVASIHELPVEALAEIQSRVNTFESGGNYPKLEVLATAIGGAGGEKNLTESAFRARLLQGSEEIEAAFKTDELALHVDAGLRDTLTAQFGGRVGSSTLQGVMNIMSWIPFVGIAPWVAIPGLAWNLLRQPEVRELLGGLVLKDED